MSSIKKTDITYLFQHTQHTYGKWGKLEIHSSIFKYIKPDLKSCSDKCNNCIAIERMLTILAYYSHLEINNDNKTKDESIFINFIQNVYKYKIYHGFHHLTKYHQNDVKLIMNLEIKSYIYYLNVIFVHVYIVIDIHKVINQPGDDDDEKMIHLDVGFITFFFISLNDRHLV